MANKRLGERRRGQVIQCAIDHQVQIDWRERTNQKQCLCKQKKKLPKK
jgi:hypothetical protein